MSKQHILAVDDEEDVLALIQYNLEKEGYQVSLAESGEEAIEKCKSALPDLVLLDLMLPGIDGLEVCRILKNNKQTADIPILMLTAKGEEIDIVTGLEIGADDYMTKPFSPRVVIARIRALLRRGKHLNKNNVSEISIHNISINADRFDVRVNNEPVSLTATEFQILFYLITHPGWVFTRSQIIDAVKGDDYPVTDRSVDVQIVGLRKKLNSAGQYIETIHGIGYRFKESE